ncbi:MAG: UvrD-helicase domain-containing protein, partial [Halanaerobium sp.]
MYKIYQGNTGSGKSTILKEKYQQLVENYRSENILLFLKSAKNVSAFRDEIDLKMSGNLNIYTYFGFVNEELNKNWPEVEKKYSEINKVIEPTFMNIETSHFLMSNYVEKYRNNRLYFKNIKARPVQIAVQLIDNLNLAAFNMLNFKELKKRLISWTKNDEERNKYAEQSVEIMKTFRDFCLKYRLLDYSTAITIFNKYLLANTDYIKQIQSKYKYILVDDLEKMIPAGQVLIKKITAAQTNGVFTFNKSGGFNRFFGGNPAAAEKRFFADAEEIINLHENYTASEESRELADKIEKVIKKREGSLIKSKLLKEEIDSELRGEMLIKVGKRIISLLKDGVEPASIAVISPQIDKVLSFSLRRILEKNGYNLSNFNRSKRLVDIPFARALLILYLFQSEKTEMIGISALQQTLSLLLELDPLRSYILAEEIAASGMEFVDLD